MDETPMHIAYEEAKKDATELNIPVTGKRLKSTENGKFSALSITKKFDYYFLAEIH